jgi:WD40 repeat protein
LGSVAEQFPGLAATADGMRLLTWADFGPLKEWDLATGKLRRTHTAEGQKPRIRSVEYVPDNQTIQVNEDGFTTRLLSAQTSQTVAPPEGLKGFVGEVMHAPDGKRLLTVAYKDGTVELREAVSGKVQQTLPAYDVLQQTAEDGTISIAPGIALFSPDGKDLLIAGQRYQRPTLPATMEDSGKDLRAVLIWDVEKGRLRTCLAYPGNLKGRP